MSKIDFNTKSLNLKEKMPWQKLYCKYKTLMTKIDFNTEKQKSLNLKKKVPWLKL